MDRNDSITLEEDPVYAGQYEKERERIRDVSEDRLLGVFHVGSTAISDVSGKSSLDIIAVFADEESMRAAADTLVKTGYELEHDESDCRVLIDWGEPAVIVKLHVRDDEKVRNQLVFRNYLRENPDARREYERVKRDAAAEHPDDIEAYTQAKWDVVASVLERAREKGYTDRLPEFA